MVLSGSQYSGSFFIFPKLSSIFGITQLNKGLTKWKSPWTVLFSGVLFDKQAPGSVLIECDSGNTA